MPDKARRLTQAATLTAKELSRLNSKNRGRQDVPNKAGDRLALFRSLHDLAVLHHEGDTFGGGDVGGGVAGHGQRF